MQTIQISNGDIAYRSTYSYFMRERENRPVIKCKPFKSAMTKLPIVLLILYFMRRGKKVGNRMQTIQVSKDDIAYRSSYERE
jgi:hypothetical protein